MKKEFFLGIDQGTTGVTAILFDRAFQAVARGYAEITQYYPQAGWVEHDLFNLRDAMLAAVTEALQKAEATPDTVLAIGLDHEGESMALWDSETGAPLAPAIVWQDRRTAERAEELDRTHGDLFRARTALTPDSYFSATKLEWLLANTKGVQEAAKKGTLRAGNMDAWLLFCLTGGKEHKTDASTASRTMLYNIEKGAWDADICAILGIDTAILPEVGDSIRPFGVTAPEAFLGIKAPVFAMLNDQQAALLGQGCVRPGMMKTTYGTGCFMLMNTGDAPVRSQNGLVTTVAWQIDGKRTYALDGGVYIAGAAVQWLRDGLGIITSAKECGPLATSIPDNGGVYFVPAFAGLAAPHWDATAAGTLIGLTGGTTRAHIVRATEEAIAYQVTDLADAMAKDAGVPLTCLRCDGGAVHDKFLMQFQADILNIPLQIPTCADATALGVAFAAAVGAGYAAWEQAEGLFTAKVGYTPANMTATERTALLDGWHRAVDRAKGWRG